LPAFGWLVLTLPTAFETSSRKKQRNNCTFPIDQDFSKDIFSGINQIESIFAVFVAVFPVTEATIPIRTRNLKVKTRFGTLVVCRLRRTLRIPFLKHCNLRQGRKP